MNENLNLVEILKYCPKGTKLYSPALGEVDFAAINYYDRTYSIIVKTEDRTFCFTYQGKLYDIEQSECLLFPSKDLRDWSKFNLKKEESSFQEGDWVVRGDTIAQILDVQEQYYVGLDINGKDFVSSRFLNNNKIHLWTIQDAKDGDVLAAHECYVVFKEIDGLNIKCYCTYHYLGLNPSFYRDTLQNKDAFLPATKEQRDAMMKAMNDAGYEWNKEKKELKKKKVK